MSIVCAADGSRASRAAAQYAGRLAETLELPLVLVSVVSVPEHASAVMPPLGPTLADRAVQDARAVLQAIAEELDVAPLTFVKAGAPAPEVLAVAEEQRATLLVVGSRGRGAVTAAVLGSVSASLAAHAPCPVVIVREGVSLSGDGPIVAAVADDDRAAGVAALAAGLRDQLGGRLTLVHAAPSLAGAVSAPPAASARRHRATLADGEAFLSDLALAEGFGPSVGRRVVLGSPAESLASVAEAEGAGMVVVGARHATSMLRAAVLGSVSTELIRRVPCPVVVARPTAAASARLARHEGERSLCS